MLTRTRRRNSWILPRSAKRNTYYCALVPGYYVFTVYTGSLRVSVGVLWLSTFKLRQLRVPSLWASILSRKLSPLSSPSSHPRPPRCRAWERLPSGGGGGREGSPVLSCAGCREDARPSGPGPPSACHWAGRGGGGGWSQQHHLITYSLKDGQLWLGGGGGGDWSI